MEYKKDFDKWNFIKKSLDENKNQVQFFCEKEIWWCVLGVNIGSEQDGKGNLYIRPVYIIKKINSRTFLGIPLTKKLKEDKTHLSFYFNYDLSTALIAQIKVFDKGRLVEKIGVTSDYLNMKMKKATVAFVSG